MRVRPSSAARLIACPGSVAAEADFPNTTSIHAATGTAAHSLLEECHNEHLIPSDFIGQTYEVDGFKVSVDENMASKVQAALDVYDDYSGRYAGLDAEIHLEVPLKFGELVGLPDEQATGTADCVIIHTDTIYVLDYKNGEGVYVDVADNAQLKTYALAAMRHFNKDQLINRVVTVVIQPGMNNVAECDYTAAELDDWGVHVLRHAVNDAHNNPWRAAGNHCKFCKAASTCPTLNQRLMDEFEALPNPTRDEDAKKLGDAMRSIPLFQAWIREVTSACNHRLNEGLPVAGYKLVEGRRGNRKWGNEREVVDHLERLHLEPDYIYDMSLQSPARIERLLKEGVITKDEWNQIQAHITRAAAKPTIAPETDPRPDISSRASANDFEAFN